MSSSVYVAEISSSKALRRVVLASSAILAMLGFLCLQLLPIEPAWRLSAGAIWLAVSAVEIRKFRQLHITFSHMCFHADGKVQLLAHGTPGQQASILPGSVLLGGVGWIRLRSGSTASFAELVSAKSQKNKQWRRLRVIWRHL